MRDLLRVWVLTCVVCLLIGPGPGGIDVSASTASPDKEEKKGEEQTLPLEPAREIEFATTEGTWLSLDVSPDGGSIIFELLGDLYSLPIEGGQATSITEGMAFDSQPVYSPDGKWIAFLSDRDGAENLWIARPDGSEPKQLTREKKTSFASPAWSPDGDYVIVSRSSWGLAAFELWMVHLQGGSGIQITKAKPKGDETRNERHNALGVVASPDGRYLYYAKKTGGFAYNATFPLWQIARRDRRTGDEDVITGDLGSAFRPELSPDGTLLVYGTRHDAKTGLRIRDLGTGEDRWLVYPVQRDDQESRFTRDLLPGTSFTPDGRAVITTWDGRIHRVDVASGESSVIPFTADVDQKLGPRLYFPHRIDDGSVRVRVFQDPVPSPDGSRLAFSALTGLYLAELPTGTVQRVPIGDARAFQPTWAPDGRSLAYVTWSEGKGDLWTIRVDGRGRVEPRRVSRNSAFYSDPVWSPDGSKIVTLRGLAYQRVHKPTDFGQLPGMDLVWFGSGGGDANLIAPARGAGKPHFGPEEDRVYVYSEGGLISMRLDGTDRRNHLQVKGTGIYFAEEPVPASDVRISPDGRWALAHVSNQLFVVAVPPVGGESPTINVDSPSVPTKQLTSVGADYFGWAEKGATLTWAVGSTFLRRPFDSIIFEEKKEESDTDEEESDANGEEATSSTSEAAEPVAGETPDGEAEEDENPFELAEDEEGVEKIEIALEVPRDIPRGTIILRGGTAITMVGEEVVRDSDIVVRDNRIVAVGKRGEVGVPEGATIRDVSGYTILPGFIDTHAHWFEIRRGILDEENWSFLANLAYGVTTGLDVQTSTNDMFAYQDLVDAGHILGPRAFSTGPGIFSDNDFQSSEEAAAVIRKYRDHYRTRHLKSYVVGNRKQQQFVAEASAELEMMPTTEGALDLKLDITHAIDGFNGNEHSLPIVPLARDVVELYARSGIGYTPTLLVSYGGPFAENAFYTEEDVHGDEKLNRFTPHNLVDLKSRRRPWFHEEEHVYPKLAAEAAKIVRAGGRVGIGSHGQLQGLGYHWEMWALASGGLTEHEVLRAATRHGAEMLGFQEDLGTIEPGKFADLVILEKNPLEDIRNTRTIRWVMKNGELFEGDTLEQLWPEEKELAPFWWWDERP